MRKLVLADKKAALKAAEDNVRALVAAAMQSIIHRAFALTRVCQYLKDMVARHIREAKAAAEAKVAAANAAKFRAKLDAAARRAAAAAAARKEHEDKLLRAQLCSRASQHKPLSAEQCECERERRGSMHLTPSRHPCQATRPSN
jgi:translation initiation factor 2B subunit (eIF-2B alpha/beta/delta family)